MTNQAPDLSSLLRDHALSKELRSKDANAVLTRSVLDIPPADRAETFSTGTCEAAFVQQPAVMVSGKAKTVLAIFFMGPGSMGHRGYAHGGALATIMDECCGRAAVSFFQGVKIAAVGAEPNGDTSVESLRSVAVTAQLSVSYVAPVPTDSCIIVQAIVDDSASSARKAKVVARLWSLPQLEQADRGETLCAEAQSVFIEPRTPNIS